MRSPYKLPEQRQDDGFFGPGSIVWDLNGHPCAVHAAICNTLLFELYPSCAALSDSVDSLYTDPIGRARRTLTYVHHVVFGDTATAHQAAAFVRRLHDCITIEFPKGSGRTICAADPDQLLWLHMTQADSMLRAHRTYGRRLTPVELDRFWSEFRPFAELQGVPREMVPGSQAEADAYFAQMRTQLRRTDAGDRAIRQVMSPEVDGHLGRVLRTVLKLVGPAAVELLDDHELELLGRKRMGLMRYPVVLGNKAFIAGLQTRFTRDVVAHFGNATAAQLLRESRRIGAEHTGAPKSAPRVVLPQHAKTG